VCIMDAEHYLREGNIQQALIVLQNQIKSDPSNAKYRVFLFQLLTIIGKWERALTQLNVAGEMDAGTLAMVQTYREAIRCEVLRAKVFSGQTTPMIFGQPEQWLANLVLALGLDAQGKHEEALQIRQQALSDAPATSGSINGAAFEWIADADSRLGPVLDAVVNGRYYWVPFHRIAKISLEKPVDLRDLVWMPAQLTWTNGGGAVALIPSRYSGSESSEDSAIQLSRKTEWQALSDEQYIGLGQKIFVTDVDDYPICEIREVTLNCSDCDTDG
jgi:type VI secretion system protein ImpE